MARRATAAAARANGQPPTFASLAVAQLAVMASEYNPRSIGDHDLAALRRSLREFGAVQPVLVNKRSGRIVGGHQRVKAAQAEGFTHLPVMYVDLDDVRERQLNLALNRIQGEFDPDKLAQVLADMQAQGADLTLTGFDAGELEKLVQTAVENLGTMPDPPAPSLPATPRTKPGDVIELGVHRLVCGDATKDSDVDFALDGDVADAMWTDPPYGVDYEGGKRVRHVHRPPLCCGAHWCRCVEIDNPETYPVFGDPKLIEFAAGGVNG